MTDPTTNTITCPFCGRQLRLFAGCLHCAMTEALEAARVSPDESSAVSVDEGFPCFAEPKLPVRAGRFLLLSRLGVGGMGTVYEAEDTTLDRTVALKMIRSLHFASESERVRFTREAQMTARLDHPHIVPVFETGELHGQPFLAMKLIKGGTLGDVMKAGPLPVERAVAIMAKLASAVQHAHEHGVQHRDLKPSNILIDEQGQPWLTDFGLARLRSGVAGETMNGAQIGTPMYMAPEQAAGRTDEVGPQSDVWALGALFYQMLSGKAPFETGEDLAVIQAVLSSPPPRLKPASRQEKGLAVLIERCLQKDPAQRLPSAGFLAAELERWQNGEKLITRRRLKLRRFAALAVIAVLALAGWWLMQPADDYVISTRDGVMTITSRGAENEVLELIASDEKRTLTAVAAGRRFSVHGLRCMEESGALPLAGVRQLVIETGPAKDRVKFRGKLLLEKDASLELRPESEQAGFCEVYIDQLAELRASGTGSIRIQASAGIEVDTEAIVEVENGPLNLAGNWPPVAARKALVGLMIKGHVQSTGTGAVTVQGSGAGQKSNYGVVIHGGQVRGGQAGSAVTVAGHGSATGSNQSGVCVAYGGQITSLGADVAVQGLGKGDGSGDVSFGVDVRQKGEITAGGRGKVHVEGVGGAGSGGGHIGVHITTEGRISSTGGDVDVSGTAGENGVGVRLSDGSIHAGGSGSVTISGTGTLGGGKIEDAYGVELRKKPGTLITTEGGAISITGKGGSAQVADILLAAGAQISTLAHGGKITLNGEHLSIAPESVQEGVVKGEAPKPDFKVSRTADELSVMDVSGLGGVVIIQEAAPGQIHLVLAPEAVIEMPDASRRSGKSGPLSLKDIQQLKLKLGSGDDRLEFHGFSGDDFPSIKVDAGPGDDRVQFRGRLSLADGQHVNLDLQDGSPELGADSVLLLSGAAIITHGKGAITMRASRKILLTEAALRTEHGDITLEANQQEQASTGNIRGVELIGSQLVSEGTGAITLSGRGGNEGNFQFGICLDKGSIIQGGTTGRVSLTGTGGDNGLNDNTGICLKDGDCQIFSRGADIELRGTGMGKPGSGYNFGIALVEGRVTTAGAGNVTLTGQGGATLGWSNTGILLREAVVSSENGVVSVTGHGGGTESAKGGRSDGILIEKKGRISSTGSGSVTVVGTGGSGAAAEHQGVLLRTEGQISSSGGAVQVTGTGGSAGGVGVLLSSGSSVSSGGKGALTVEGTGVRGSGADGNASGIVLADDPGPLITTAGGDARLTGHSSSPETAAIHTVTPARITTQEHGGKLTLIGAKLDLAEGTVDPEAEVKAQP